MQSEEQATFCGTAEKDEAGTLTGGGRVGVLKAAERTDNEPHADVFSLFRKHL